MEKLSDTKKLLDLRNMGRNDLGQFVESLGEPRFRADQVFRWVHGQQIKTIDEMTNISKSLREKLNLTSTIGTLSIDKIQTSSDGTKKFRLKTSDERLTETVLIPSEAYSEDIGSDEADLGRVKLTQCISSQVGCAIDCQFCATAKLGFGRHLSSGEIVSQVYLADEFLSSLPSDDPTVRFGGAKLTNLVFMGMGEPFHNYDNVIRSLEILTDSHGKGFGRRKITVSTSGLIPAIERFAKERTRVNLAISLNATTDEQRSKIMPINKTHGLIHLIKTLHNYPLDKKQTFTIEYVLLAGVNDSIDDAKRLPDLLRGIPCKINLIPWNPHPGSPFIKPTQDVVSRFQKTLMDSGFLVYVRKTKGDDIDAACGQLAAAFDDRAKRQKPLRALPVV